MDQCHLLPWQKRQDLGGEGCTERSLLFAASCSWLLDSLAASTDSSAASLCHSVRLNPLSVVSSCQRAGVSFFIGLARRVSIGPVKTFWGLTSSISPCSA